MWNQNFNGDFTCIFAEVRKPCLQGHPAVRLSGLVCGHHDNFIAIHEFKLEFQFGNTKFGSKSSIFQPL